MPHGRKAGVCLVTCTTSAASSLIDITQSLLREKRLESRQNVMVWVHSGEVFLSNFFHHCMVLVNDPVSCDGLDNATCEQLSKREVGRLIVDDFPFIARALLSRELASDGAIANSNLGRGKGEDSRGPNQLHPDGHHHGVEDSWVSLKREITLARDFAHAHHHVGSRDAHLVEACPAIVLTRVADFGAKIAALDTRLDFPSLRVPDLHHEGLHSVVVLINYEPCKDDRVAREHAHVTWPVFGRHHIRRVDNELVCLFVQRGCSLQSSHVRAMC
mmetsp:Transcript_1144/g.1507  ORF Transcript_1144/g.1507 Transcript_1144/m.1507 type:complete len:273 (-) Transcript_1144:471-1289(-)